MKETPKKAKVAQAASKQLRKVKSIVGMANNHKKFENSPSSASGTPRKGRTTRAGAATPTRSSSRLQRASAATASPTNGVSSAAVETAMEVTEENQGGFLRKSLSKIWVPGFGYQSVEGESGGDAVNTQRETRGSSCVIS